MDWTYIHIHTYIHTYIHSYIHIYISLQARFDGGAIATDTIIVPTVEHDSAVVGASFDLREHAGDECVGRDEAPGRRGVARGGQAHEKRPRRKRTRPLVP